MSELKKYLDTTALGTLVDQIKAEDAKVLAAAKKYTDEAPFDAAGSAATAESNAKAYTDELANGQVKLNKEAIAKLNGAATEEGSVAKAVADAKALIDADVDAVEAIANQNKTDIAAINNAETGILALAKKYADEEDAKVEELVAGVAEDVEEVRDYVGTFTASEGVDTVVKYIDAKTANVASDERVNAIDDRLTQAEKDIDAIEADYLKKEDKDELAGDIATAQAAAEAAQAAADAAQGEVDALEQTHATDKKNLEDAIALKADQTALDEVSAVANAAVKQSDYDVKVKALEDEDARIAGLVAEEAERAAGVEESLQNQINTIMSNPDAEGAINSINEFTQYVTEHGTIADGFRTDIDKNKEDIAAHVALDHDFAGADAALKAELEGKINAKADASVVEELSGTVATKAAQADLEALDDRVEALETASETHALKTEVEAISEAMNEYVEAHANDYTNAQIDEAIKVVSDNVAALNDTYASDEELAAAIEEVKTDSSNKDAVVLANAQNFASELNSAMDERVAAVEAASATHALASDLTALDGRVGTLETDMAQVKVDLDAVEALADAADKAAKANAEALALKASQADLEAAVARIAVNEGAISTINGTLADKADADDLDAAIERIAKNETDIAANASAIAKFQPISSAEVEALFA